MSDRKLHRSEEPFLRHPNQNQARKTVVDFVFYKKYYPQWSTARCFWEAVRESLQTALDGGGMIPLIGEVCDLTNATIYAISGDGVNASLSAAGAVPFAGWAATGAKYAIMATSTANRKMLRWIVKTDGLIDFGDRNLLRGVMGLTGKFHAHHIIPWELKDNILVQKAAKSKDAFHMNDLINGIPLPTSNHLTGHHLYNSKISQILHNFNQSNPGASNEQAYNFLVSLKNQIKTHIENYPNYNLGQIANLIQ